MILSDKSIRRMLGEGILRIPPEEGQIQPGRHPLPGAF